MFIRLFSLCLSCLLALLQQSVIFELWTGKSQCYVKFPPCAHLVARDCQTFFPALDCMWLWIYEGPSLRPHPARCTFWYTIFKHSALFLLVRGPRQRSHSAALVSLHCAWPTKHFSPIVSGTIILIFSPLAVSLLSHSETLTLKRSFLACVGRIKACVGRTVIAVTLDCKFLAICQCGLRLSHKTLHHYSWIWIDSLSA